MASSSESIFGVTTSRVAIPPGATLAVFVENVAGQGALLLKYFSGGTLEIHGAALGTTMPGASLVALNGAGYVLGSSEVVALSGPTRLYLMASGATAVACLMKGITAPGYSS